MKILLCLILALYSFTTNAVICHNRPLLIYGADSLTINYFDITDLYGVTKNYEIHITPYDYSVRNPYREGCQDSLLMPLISLADSLFAQATVPMYTQKERSGGNLHVDGNILQVKLFRKGNTSTMMLPQMGIYSLAPSETEDGYVGTYSSQYRLFVQRLHYVIASLSGMESLAKYWNTIMKYKYDEPGKLVLFPDKIPLYGCNKNNRLCEEIIEKALNNFGTMPYIYKYAYDLGKDLIPLLVKHIDDMDNGQLWFSDFLDAYDNPSPRYYFGNRIGIRYAHLIDFIVSTDSLSMSKCCNEKIKSEWENPSHFFKVYDKCVISRRNEVGSLSDNVLTYDDMARIKEIYQKWWDENKKYDLGEIRKKWNRKYGLLTNTIYSWR